jgi:hypothetical protein
MRQRAARLTLGFIASAAVILIFVAPAASQWQPLPSPQGPTGQTPQYPPQPVPYPPQQPPYPPQQQQYPPSQQYPPQQQQQQPAQIQPGQAFPDAFGRFRVTLPGGTMPSGVTYNFVLPTASAFVNIMSTPQDQMFQMQMRNFPAMLQQMGAKIDTNQQSDLRGKPAQFIAATMKDQQSGTSMHSMNVFVQGPNVWFQVMGPEQNTPQLAEIMNVLLKSAQFQ